MEKKLPTDVMLDIISRLPHETIIHCKLVCKPWRDILNNIKVGVLFRYGKPAFNFCYGGEQYDDIDMHGNYSYMALAEIDKHRPVELEPLSDMVGSCNGLVCFSVRRKFTVAYDPIYICNPVTEEYVYLPTFNYDEPYDDPRVAGCFDCGFGYHHSMDEYKVVRIHGALGDFSPKSRKVQVYTLGSGHGWRYKGSIDHLLVWDHGVCANGAIHWVEYRKNKIVAFDLADEEFRLIPLPPQLPKTEQYGEFETISLKLLGCQLCVVHIDIGNVEDVIHIWELEKKKTFRSDDMKKNDQFDDLWRWKKKFSIPCTKGEIYMPFAVTKSNQVLMSYNKHVLCYDAETGILTTLLDDSPGKITRAIPHVNSRVSLQALGEKSKRRR